MSQAIYEIFGPVVSIIEFNTDQEAIEIANSSIYGLSSCVFSRNVKRAMQISSSIQAGEVVINGSGFLRSFEMPFGGWKFSGIGTEGVMSTFEEMTKIKTIVFKGYLLNIFFFIREAIMLLFFYSLNLSIWLYFNTKNATLHLALATVLCVS